jgi:hypothetical protein
VTRPILLPAFSANQSAPRRRHGEFAQRPAGRDAADPIPRFLGEPHGAIRTGRDSDRLRIGRGQRIFADRASRRNAPDPVSEPFGEPHRAVWTRDDLRRRCVNGRDREFNERAAGRHAPDPIRVKGVLGKPHRAAGARRDCGRLGRRARNGEHREPHGR